MIEYTIDYEGINEDKADLDELITKIENGETLKGVRLA